MRIAAVHLAATLVVATACSKAGLGQGVRTDVAARMASAEEPIAACYHAALQRNRKLAGSMEVTFTAEAKTGAFVGARVTRDEVGDPELSACVLAEIGKLALAAPPG
ncbi:MAG: hypothetical protein R2939_09915 [Kofleriaceae bacterium]